MALVLVLMLAIYGVQSASLPLSNPSDSSEGRLDASTDLPDVSDGVLDTLAARLDIPDTLDAPSQEASVRQADSSSSEDARSDEPTPPEATEKLAELRTPLESDLSNPLDTLASKLAALPNPIGALDSIVGTLGSEKVRRSVLEDVKQLIETKFSALLEDGVKRIAGKKGILKQGLKLKPTSPLVLRVQEKDRESSEELESSNSGMIKVLTDGPLQDSGDLQLRTVVDELLKEDEDRTEDKEILDSKEDRLSIENLSRSQKDAETIEDYDDINSESYRRFDNIVKENSPETNKNKEITEEPENILDLDEILKTALGDSSDSLNQENVDDDNDKDQNLTAESMLSRLLETKNDRSDEILSEIEYKPQKTAETEEHVESNIRNGIDVVQNDNDERQAYGASNIDIDENELQTESIHPHQNVDEEENATNLLKQGQNLGNLIHLHENKTESDLRNHNEYISSETIHPSHNDELSDAYQLLNIKKNDKSDDLIQIHEQNDLNAITGANKYAQLEQSLARSEDQNEDKQATQHQAKTHHHHHRHHHHHQHHSRHSNSEDLPIPKTGATHENTALDELKNYNTEKKENHLKGEIDEEKNIPLKIKQGIKEENNLKTEDNDVVKERKSTPEEDKNIHEESDAGEKSSEKGPESETSEARTALKNAQIIGGQIKKPDDEKNNSKELLDEVQNRNGIDEKIYLADDNDYLIGKRRKGSDNKVKLAEEDINGARNDYVTTHHKYGCHDKNHRERKGKSDDNHETNINKIKSYSLSMTFSTNQ